MLRFKFEHGDDIDSRKPAAGARTDFCRSAAGWTIRRRDYADWGFEDASGGGHSRGYEAGVRHFGENRVQEWEGKQGGIQDLNATWHLIGHLQSNKAARAAKLFHCIDSVDDFALAQRLDRARSESGVTGKMRVLIEVHIAEEETKTGADRERASGAGGKDRRVAYVGVCRADVHSAVCGECGEGEAAFQAAEGIARRIGRSNLGERCRCCRWECRTTLKWRSKKGRRKCAWERRYSERAAQ